MAEKTPSAASASPPADAGGRTACYFWLHVLGCAVGFFEAAVVIYLRELYYPDGFRFPLALASMKIGAVEVAREFASIVLLAAAARLAGRFFLERFAAFALLFGSWDLWYYVFLKLVLDWPDSLATADILFLIPVPWIGPVWAPCVIALSLVAAGSLVYLTPSRPWHFSRRDWTILSAGGLIVIVSMTLGWRVVPEGLMPEPFPVWIFWGGWVIGIARFAQIVRRTSSHGRQTDPPSVASKGRD
jgi:hypothetical protein